MALSRRRIRALAMAIRAGSTGGLLIDSSHPGLALTRGGPPGLSAENLNCASAGDSKQPCHEATE